MGSKVTEEYFKKTKLIRRFFLGCIEIFDEMV